MPPTKRKADALLGDDEESSSASKKMPANSIRARSGPGAISAGSSPRLPDLPATAWGNVLDFLPYHEVRNALLLCKAVYFEGATLVTRLHIYHANELNVGVARRFINVENIEIGCVVTGDGALSPKAVGRVVPFMIIFPKLRKCRIGGFDERCAKSRRYTLHACTGPNDHWKLFRSMLESLCIAFESNALSKSLYLHGFITSVRRYNCTPTVETSDHECRLCRRIVNSFPLNQIIHVPGMTHISDIYKISKQRFCMPHDQCLSIIRSRNWTEKCIGLLHPSRLLRLTSRTLNTSVLVKDNKTQKDVSYDIAYAIDSDKITRLELMAEIVNAQGSTLHLLSKAEAMKCMNQEEPKGDYLLERGTFDRLVAIGFRLEESDFAAVVDLSDQLR